MFSEVLCPEYILQYVNDSRPKQAETLSSYKLILVLKENDEIEPAN